MDIACLRFIPSKFTNIDQSMGQRIQSDETLLKMAADICLCILKFLINETYYMSMTDKYYTHSTMQVVLIRHIRL